MRVVNILNTEKKRLNLTNNHTNMNKYKLALPVSRWQRWKTLSSHCEPARLASSSEWLTVPDHGLPTPLQRLSALTGQAQRENAWM